MFVLASTHRDELEKALNAIRYLKTEYESLLNRWNSLVRRINQHGGEAIFNRPIQATSQFSKEEIKALLQLVHPDKHDGKDLAVRMTQKLIQLRDSL